MVGDALCKRDLEARERMQMWDEKETCFSGCDVNISCHNQRLPSSTDFYSIYFGYESEAKLFALANPLSLLDIQVCHSSDYSLLFLPGRQVSYYPGMV
jgi:hypothetical protein